MIDTRYIPRGDAKPAKSVVDRMLDEYYSSVYQQRNQAIWEAGWARIMAMELEQ